MPSAARTSTEPRSLRMGSFPWELEDGDFGVGAEHGLQGLDDLALRGMYARAVEEVRHQVAIGGGGGAQLGQRALDRGPVAPGADGLDAADLLALERGVDAEDLELSVAALGEVVDADEDPLARVVLALELVRGIGDLALREALLDR